MSKNEFKCAQCDRWRPSSDLGKVKSLKGFGQNRCKSCVAASTKGETELVKQVHDDIEDNRVWVRGCCENQNCCNVGPVTETNVGKKIKSYCPECAETWEGHKQYRAQGVEPKDHKPIYVDGKKPFRNNGERLDYMLCREEKV